MSLLPTDDSEFSILLPTDTAASIKARSRQFRCHSSEPGFLRSGRRRSDSRSPERKTLTLSSLCLEGSTTLKQLQAACPITPPRKRLSLSDSEICYAENVEEEDDDADAIKSPETEVVAIPENEKLTELPEVEEVEAEEVDPQEVSEGDPREMSDEPTESLSAAEVENEVDSESTVTTSDEGAPEQKQEESAAEEEDSSQPRRKKSVRFADEVGCELYRESIIADTSLPPLLNKLNFEFLNDDDLGDMYDDGLPGLLRQNFVSSSPSSSSGSFFGSKHSLSLPDMMKMPPPVPGATPLHRCCSSTDNNNNSNQGSPLSLLGSPLRSPMSPQSDWRLTFAQPAVQYLAFRQRLEAKCVSLENVSMSWGKQSAESLCVYGTVKVKNIAFAKHVFLRVTCDKWASQQDFPAVHAPQMSANGGGPGGSNRFDAFMFNFCIDFAGKPAPRELQFAVCFSAGDNGSGGEFWDNNDGCNYILVEETSPILSDGSSTKTKLGAFFCSHPPSSTVSIGKTPGRASVGVSDGKSTRPPISAYTLDYRPNFDSFSSLTSYSSYKHYAKESMYY